MELIEMTRELGKALQSDERYIGLRVAQQQCDEDIRLQELISDFNLKRIAIDNEAQKEDRNEEAVRKLNEELREIYGRIMENESMARYNEAKNAFDSLFQEILGILSLCSQGQDPATCVYDPAVCGGNCAGCSGCQ